MENILIKLQESCLKSNEDLDFIYEEEEDQIKVLKREWYFATITNEENRDLGVCYRIWPYIDTTEEGFSLDDLIVLGKIAEIVKEYVN